MSNPNKFRFEYTIGLHDTDAADYLFSANLITICHIGYEAMLKSIGIRIANVLKEKRFAVPVVHIECDFQQRLTVSDEVEISVWVSKLGNSSYTMSYELRNKNGELCATASTVHVCVDWGSSNSIPLPDDLRAAISKYA